MIYGAGKTPEQIARIVDAMRSGGQDTILITRMSDEAAAAIDPAHPFTYYEMGRIGIVGSLPSPDGSGKVVVATGGTSDMPVAEEAALTAEALGNEVVRLYDVGVAGLHRLLSHLEELMSANVIIAIAGMEGALASVIGGLADCPVIAVPTSIGYGACFHGLSSLLSMLNSCASGVSVVNIDNGFGAGYLASMIDQLVFIIKFFLLKVLYLVRQGHQQQNQGNLQVQNERRNAMQRLYPLWLQAKAGR